MVITKSHINIKNIWHIIWSIIAPAFSSDCVETLEEINEEIAESFSEAGGETFLYIPCLNDRDDHIKALINILENELSGWL